MPDLRKGFISHCPNNHEVTPIFDVDKLRAALARGHVQYFCFRCGKDWTLSLPEQANLREWLDSLFSTRLTRPAS